MRFIPRREGSRKPVTATHNFDPSNPWGDVGSTNVSPKTTRGNKPADQVERERKTAMNAESATKPKAKVIAEKVAPSYRNDID
jgi:hypothetical protein